MRGISFSKRLSGWFTIIGGGGEGREEEEEVVAPFLKIPPLLLHPRGTQWPPVATPGTPPLFFTATVTTTQHKTSELKEEM